MGDILVPTSLVGGDGYLLKLNVVTSNTMPVQDDFPKFDMHLVTTLASLRVNNFMHFDEIGREWKRG